jgi:hypothetical protein
MILVPWWPSRCMNTCSVPVHCVMCRSLHWVVPVWAGGNGSQGPASGCDGDVSWVNHNKIRELITAACHQLYCHGMHACGCRSMAPSQSATSSGSTRCGFAEHSLQGSSANAVSYQAEAGACAAESMLDALLPPSVCCCFELQPWTGMLQCGTFRLVDVEPLTQLTLSPSLSATCILVPHR